MGVCGQAQWHSNLNAFKLIASGVQQSPEGNAEVPDSLEGMGHGSWPRGPQPQAPRPRCAEGGRGAGSAQLLPMYGHMALGHCAELCRY